MPMMSSDAWRIADLRNTKGISLEEIARDTKIKVSTLKAIEDGNFGALPGGIYTTSYIRQYARAIGMDEGSLLELYRAKFVLDTPQSLAS